MKKIFLVCIFIFLLSSTWMYSADEKFVLVIDAGHGGKDTGATRGEYKEKSINLGVALALGKLIESNMKDVKVVYTRKSDVFVDLYKRAEIANKSKANLFVSIHTNSTAARTTTAQGADIYILGLARSDENLAVAKRENSVILLEDNYNKRYEGFDPNSPESYIIFEFMTDKYMEQSLEFATHVQKGFFNVARRKDRGVRQAGFLVLRESAMPSVLIELGFINNPSEAKYLSASTGQRSMASAIYSGIEKYVKDFDKKKGIASTSPSAPAPRDERLATPIAEQRRTEALPTAETRVQQTQTDNEAPVVQRTESRYETGAQNEPQNTRPVVTPPAPTYNTSNTSVSPFISKNKDVNELQQIASVSANTETDATEGIPVVNRSSASREKGPALNRNIKVEPESVTKPATSTRTPANTYSAGAVEYRVQFMISPRKLPNNSPQFKGLSPVDVYIDNGTYKYTYGSASSESEIVGIRNQIKPKFKDAFVIQFRNGVRIK